MNQTLSLRKAAIIIGVHHNTLRRWILDGEGPRTFIKNGKRSTYRITLASLQAFINQRSRGGK